MRLFVSIPVNKELDQNTNYDLKYYRQVFTCELEKNPELNLM